MRCIGDCILNRLHDAFALTHSFIRSFIAICRAHYVDNVESEALKAVARWSIIGKIVSF